MKRPKVYIWSFLFCIAAVALASSCDDEVEPYRNEPAVKIRFFNIDSLTKINTSIAAIDAEIALLNTENAALTTELSTLNTRLTELDGLIADGREDLAPERASVASEIAIVTERQVVIRASLDAWNAEKAQLTKVVGTINSGRVLLKKIEAEGKTLEFTDSATTFSLPLNMNTTSQVYYLEVGSRRDSLELTYNVAEELTERSYIKLVGTNIERTEGKYSYDSVTVYCKSLPEPCSGNETTINVYF